MHDSRRIQSAERKAASQTDRQNQIIFCDSVVLFWSGGYYYYSYYYHYYSLVLWFFPHAAPRLLLSSFLPPHFHHLSSTTTTTTTTTSTPISLSLYRRIISFSSFSSLFLALHPFYIPPTYYQLPPPPVHACLVWPQQVPFSLSCSIVNRP